MASISSKKVFSKNSATSNRARRSKRLASAALVFHDGKSSVECIVLDISETGARLHLLETVWPPNEFILELLDGRSYFCETVFGRETRYRPKSRTYKLSPQDSFRSNPH